MCFGSPVEPFFQRTMVTILTAVADKWWFQEFTADLTYTYAGSVVAEKDLLFRIEKIDNSTGLVWLWCSDSAIGIVVKLF